MSTIHVNTINTRDGTGNITVSRPLSGSGASLTNLPAANLTGALPAINGALLTNLPDAGGPYLGSSNEWIRTNSNQINQNITIPSGTNALSVGPINLNVANSITVNGVYTII
jgi:hypothetical protein